MNTATKALTAIGLTLLLAPLGQSTWSAAGNIEPSTSYDTAAWMWENAAPNGEKRIYFNAFAMTLPGGVAGASPNVAAVGSRIETPSSEFHVAIFGVWVDCNGDGYVGMAEQALREYSASLLLDASICPAATGTAGSWNGAPNYNGWVSEYAPIGQKAAPADKRVYNDDEAMVWGDYGQPDQDAFFRSCALYPQPRGTYQSTGGFLNFVECRSQQNGFDTYGNFNAAMDATGDPLALRGDDGEEFDWRTTGLEHETAGTEDESHSPVRVWDCDAEPLFHGGEFWNSSALADVQPVPAGLSNYSVYAIDPQPGDTSTPTVPALVNHSEEGIGQIDDCNPSNDAGHDFYGTQVGYVGETDFNGVSPHNKHEADWNLGFATVARGTAPLGPVLRSGASGAPGTDGGVGWTALDGSGWFSDSVYGSKLGPRTLRASLNSGDPANSQVGISPAWWLSFYAHVGSATTQRAFGMTSGRGEYASAQCGENEVGIFHGWNCDKTTWYANPDGTQTPEPYPFARPGQAYEFRDVDCYDGSIQTPAGGVGVEPAFYGDAPCS